MNLQLPLGVELAQFASLHAFVPGPNAAIYQVVAQACQAEQGKQLFLYGDSDAGKTHLLQAVCRAVAERGQKSAYVPLKNYAGQATTLLLGMQALQCVCLDDISLLAGNRDAEIALIGLIDGMRSNGGLLVMADEHQPNELEFALADLSSRLNWGGVFRLQTPDDATKLEIIINRAQQRGLELPEATAKYLMRHGSDQLTELIDTLGKLDTASLAAQRRLTIPFVKQALAL